MNSKTYDTLKYVALIGFPAFATFFGLLGDTWNIPYAAQIVTTINGTGIFLGALLQVSSHNYHKKNKEG